MESSIFVGRGRFFQYAMFRILPIFVSGKFFWMMMLCVRLQSLNEDEDDAKI